MWTEIEIQEILSEYAKRDGGEASGKIPTKTLEMPAV